MSDPTTITTWAPVIIALITTGGYAFRHYLAFRERQALRALGEKVPVPPEGPGAAMLLIGGALAGLLLADPAAHAAMSKLLPIERCKPACDRGQKCIGTICTMEAREPDTMTSTAPPQPRPPLPLPSKPKPPGPQSALDGLAVRRWTDGSDPFDRFE